MKRPFHDLIRSGQDLRRLCKRLMQHSEGLAMPFNVLLELLRNHMRSSKSLTRSSEGHIRFQKNPLLRTLMDCSCAYEPQRALKGRKEAIASIGSISRHASRLRIMKSTEGCNRPYGALRSEKI